jgi:hypothetical protein
MSLCLVSRGASCMCTTTASSVASLHCQFEKGRCCHTGPMNMQPHPVMP